MIRRQISTRFVVSRLANGAALAWMCCFFACGACSSSNGGDAAAGGRAGTGGASSGTSGTTNGTGGAGGFGGAGASGSTSTGGDGGSSGASGSAGSSGASEDAAIDAGHSSDGAIDSSAADGGRYNPCPPKGTPCVILPVGDSITFGVGSSTGGSYRVPLFHLANLNMQSITFVGANMSGPNMVDGVPFPRANSGYSGYNIDTAAGRQGISQFFPAQITKFKPDILLLMIGTNDVDSGETEIPTRLAMLMDTMLNADPSLLLVVAQIIPQQKATPDTKNQQVQAFNAAIPGLVKARAEAGKHVMMVDMYGAFTANANYSTAYLTDRLHPNDTGYEVMAKTWYAAIGSLLR